MWAEVENRVRGWRGRRRVTEAMAGFLFGLAMLRHKKVVADGI